VGEDRVAEAVPTLGGEDFAFFGRAGVPASFAFLGARSEAAGAVHGLHTPQVRTARRGLRGAAFGAPARSRPPAALGRRGRAPAVARPCRLCGALGPALGGWSQTGAFHIPAQGWQQVTAWVVPTWVPGGPA